MSTEDRDQLLATAAEAVLAPLARLCVAHGLPFARAEELFKRAYVRAARDARRSAGAAAARDVSQVSTATGINRREVARITAELLPLAVQRPAPATQVFHRWVANKALRGRGGQPRPLPRTGPAPSFEALAQSVTRHVHPRSLLDELCRLGLAALSDDGETVTLLKDSFVPSEDDARLFGFLGANVGDHLAAATDNVVHRDRRHVEQALFTDELSSESAQAVRTLTRSLWATLSAAAIPELERLIAEDKALGRRPTARARIGLFSYQQPVEETDHAPAPPSHSPRPLRPEDLQPEPRAPRDRGRRTLLGGALAAAFGSWGLAGCGGGGDDASAPADEVRLPLGGVDGGGTGAPAMMFLSAVVQTTRPLTVGGVQLDTSGSHIADADDQAVAAGQLLPGMQCRVEAGRLQRNTTPPQAMAQRVTVAEALCGPVANIDLAAGQFTLLGQTVAVTSGTVWGPGLAGGAQPGLAALALGTVLQVHGQLDTSANRTVATRVDLAPATSRWVLRGSLGALNRAQGTAAIGAQALRFSPELAATLDAGLAAGSVVRAAVQAGDGSAPLQLLALRADALQLPERAQAQIEGRITRIDSASRLVIDGVTVEVATPVAHASWLVLGARAQAQGRAVNGVLLAATVTIEPDEPVELEGSITLASTSRQTFLLKGVVVAWTPSTTWEGGTARQLSARRKVAVRGRWNADRSVLEALHIHIEA